MTQSKTSRRLAISCDSTPPRLFEDSHAEQTDVEKQHLIRSTASPPLGESTHTEQTIRVVEEPFSSLDERSHLDFGIVASWNRVNYIPHLEI